MEFDVRGLIHHTHSALAELFSDSVVRDALADHAGPIFA